MELLQAVRCFCFVFHGSFLISWSLHGSVSTPTELKKTVNSSVVVRTSQRCSYHGNPSARSRWPSVSCCCRCFLWRGELFLFTCPPREFSSEPRCFTQRVRRATAKRGQQEWAVPKELRVQPSASLPSALLASPVHQHNISISMHDLGMSWASALHAARILYAHVRLRSDYFS